MRILLSLLTLSVVASSCLANKPLSATAQVTKLITPFTNDTLRMCRRSTVIELNELLVQYFKDYFHGVFDEKASKQKGIFAKTAEELFESSLNSIIFNHCNLFEIIQLRGPVNELIKNIVGLQLSTEEKRTINNPVTSIPKDFVIQLYNEIERTLAAKEVKDCVKSEDVYKVSKAKYDFILRQTNYNVNVALIHILSAYLVKDLKADKCGKTNEITKMTDEFIEKNTAKEDGSGLDLLAGNSHYELSRASTPEGHLYNPFFYQDTFKDGLIPQNEIQEHLSRQNSLDTLPVEDNDELISLDYQRGQTYDELFQKQMSDLSVLSDNKSDNEGDQQQAQEEPKPVSTPKKVRKFDSIEEVRKSLKNKGELLKKLHEDASKIIE